MTKRLETDSRLDQYDLDQDGIVTRPSEVTLSEIIKLAREEINDFRPTLEKINLNASSEGQQKPIPFCKRLVTASAKMQTQLHRVNET
jgi:hypothetical protein